MSTYDVPPVGPTWKNIFFAAALIRIAFSAIKSQENGTVKLLKIGTPKTFAVITLKFEQGGFTIQKMQAEWQTVWTLIRPLLQERSDLDLHCLLRHIYQKT